MIFRLLIYLQLLVFNYSFSIAKDPYPKNKNIDIINYAFSLHLNDNDDIIDGKAIIDLKIKSKDVKNLRFDLISINDNKKGMIISDVSFNGAGVSFKHTNNELKIDLSNVEVLKNNKVRINYKGIPITGLIIGSNKYGDRTFFSDNWPNKARNWLPLVDHPYDKATCEFIITAPNHYQVISNGLLIEETNLENGFKLTHWKQSVPISCWLFAIGVAEFAVQYVDIFEGKSIQTWVYKQDRIKGFYDFEVPTKEAMQFFSDYVGPFAYEKLANVQSNSVGGGMEAATSIFYGDNSVTGTRSVRWRNVIIHEVAHQWFGNCVTEDDWDDVWLSEGFATYFTLMFREHAYGRDDFVKGLTNSKKQVYKFYDNNKYYTIVHNNLSDMKDVTTGYIYQKGAWILHMLRNYIGNKAFKDGIRSYYKNNFNSITNTSSFKEEMENASNMDLTIFFNQWLYSGGNIILDGHWSYNRKDRKIIINLEQVQNDGYLFEMPLEIGVFYENEILPKFEEIKLKPGAIEFAINSDKEPINLILDPNIKLLAEWNFEKK